MGLLNIGKRKINKERPQPSGRKRAGFLEKKKDYVLRARDYHRKEDYIHHLQRKAALRNPDEYSADMAKDPARKGKTYSAAMLKVFNTEDLAYLTMLRQKELNRIQSLKTNLQGTKSATSLNKRTVFVSNKNELSDLKSSSSSDVPSFEKSISFLSKDVLESSLITKPADPKCIRKQEEHAYQELKDREERLALIEERIAKVQLQRNLMGQGRRKKVKQDEYEEADSKKLPVYVWKQERKK